MKKLSKSDNAVSKKNLPLIGALAGAGIGGARGHALKGLSKVDQVKLLSAGMSDLGKTRLSQSAVPAFKLKTGLKKGVLGALLLGGAGLGLKHLL